MAFYSLAIHVQPHMVLVKGLPLNFGEGPTLELGILFSVTAACLTTCIQHYFAWLGDICHFSIVLLKLYSHV